MISIFVRTYLDSQYAIMGVFVMLLDALNTMGDEKIAQNDIICHSKWDFWIELFPWFVIKLDKIYSFFFK